MIIRGARGLGDALFLYPIIEYYINKGENVTVKTNYPEIFKELNCKTVPLITAGTTDIVARYAERFENPETNMLEDTAILADMPLPVELSVKYKCKRKFKFNTNKKICVIRQPDYPMNAKRPESTLVLVPKIEIIQEIINKFKDECYFVLAGSGHGLKPELTGIDEDLTDISVIQELLELVNSSDIVLTQMGYMLPMAEALNKKLFSLHSYAGLHTNQAFYRWLTPQKSVTRKSSVYIIDNEPINQILNKFKELLDRKEIKKPVLRRSRKFVDNFFKNKSVVILGSAPNVKNISAKKLNSFDIVVRVNNYKIFNECKRVDVFYSFLGKSIRTTNEEIKKTKCKLIYCKCPNENIITKNINGEINERLTEDFRWIYCFRSDWFNVPYYIPPVETFSQNSAFVNQVMTTGVSAIIDILRHKPTLVHIAGFDFFTSGLHNGGAAAKWKGKKGHNFEGEANVVRKLLKNDWITCESEIKDLLNKKLVWNFNGEVKKIEGQ